MRFFNSLIKQSKFAKMEAVEKVSSEVEKVLTKFSAISDHSRTLISNEINSIEHLKSSLLERKYIKRFILIEKFMENVTNLNFRVRRQPIKPPANKSHQKFIVKNKGKIATSWNGPQRSTRKNYFE